MNRYMVIMIILFFVVGCNQLDSDSDELKVEDRINELEGYVNDSTTLITSLRDENYKLKEQIELYKQQQDLLDKYKDSFENYLIGSDVDSIDIKFILSNIPEGWSISNYNNGNIAISKGYLDNDESSDLVSVIEDVSNNQRRLLVAYGRGDERYESVYIYDIKIPTRFEGGGYGDPLEFIGINKNALLFRIYGGGSSRYFMNFIFDYIDSELRLTWAETGWTIPTNDEVLVEFEEVDYITGEYKRGTLIDEEIVRESGHIEDITSQTIDGFQVTFIQK